MYFSVLLCILFTSYIDPSLPRELKVVVFNKTSLLVTWLKPEYPNGYRLKYKLFWESIEEGKFNKSVKALMEPSYVITNLSKYIRKSQRSLFFYVNTRNAHACPLFPAMM